MKLNAKTRLLATETLEAARDQKWFDNLDSAKQKEYLAKHPNSKYGDAPQKKLDRKATRDTGAEAKIKALEDKLDAMRDQYDPDWPDAKLEKFEAQANKLEKQLEMLKDRSNNTGRNRDYS